MNRRTTRVALQNGLDLSNIEALPEFLRPEEVFKLFRMGRSAGYDALHDGTIPSIRIGRRLFVPRAAILAMVAAAVEKAGA